MVTLIAAALAAAPPAVPADPHGQMAPMQHEQHEAMKEKCCCEDMAKHDGHAPEAMPHDQRGQ